MRFCRYWIVDGSLLEVVRPLNRTEGFDSGAREICCRCVASSRSRGFDNSTVAMFLVSTRTETQTQHPRQKACGSCIYNRRIYPTSHPTPNSNSIRLSIHPHITTSPAPNPPLLLPLPPQPLKRPPESYSFPFPLSLSLSLLPLLSSLILPSNRSKSPNPNSTLAPLPLVRAAGPVTTASPPRRGAALLPLFTCCFR